jgi:hypothetical protein
MRESIQESRGRHHEPPEGHEDGATSTGIRPALFMVPLIDRRVGTTHSAEN